MCVNNKWNSVKSGNIWKALTRKLFSDTGSQSILILIQFESVVMSFSKTTNVHFLITTKTPFVISFRQQKQKPICSKTRERKEAKEGESSHKVWTDRRVSFQFMLKYACRV